MDTLNVSSVPAAENDAPGTPRPATSVSGASASTLSTTSVSFREAVRQAPDSPVAGAIYDALPDYSDLHHSSQGSDIQDPDEKSSQSASIMTPSRTTSALSWKPREDQDRNSGPSSMPPSRTASALSRNLRDVMPGPEQVSFNSELRQMEQRLEAIREVSMQLQSLQDIPKQLISLASMMNRIDIKIDGLRFDYAPQDSADVADRLPRRNSHSSSPTTLARRVSNTSDYSSDGGRFAGKNIGRRDCRVQSATSSLSTPIHRQSVLSAPTVNQRAAASSSARMGSKMAPWRSPNLGSPNIGSEPASSAERGEDSPGAAISRRGSNPKALPWRAVGSEPVMPMSVDRALIGDNDGSAPPSLPRAIVASTSGVTMGGPSPSLVAIAESASIKESPSNHTSGTMPPPIESIPSDETWERKGSKSSKRAAGDIFRMQSGFFTNGAKSATGSRLSSISVGMRRWSIHDVFLEPNSLIRIAWDTVLVLNTVMACAAIPLQLTYYHSAPSPALLDFLVKYLFDGLWILDILINLRTSFFVNGELQRDQMVILKRYARRWLFPDLLSVIPLAFFKQGSHLYVGTCILKLPRLVQLGVRFAHLRHESWGEMLPAEILVVIALASHMMACIWRIAIRYDGQPDDGDQTIASKYVSDMYWVSMTLTSVGYGDIVPLGSFSKLYAIVVMFLGSVVFGATVSGCSFIVQKLLNNEVEARIKELTRFMNRRSVPEGLQRRVQHNLRKHLHYKAATALSPDVFVSLSPCMQRELCLSVLSNTVLNFPLFRNAQRSFVAELAQAHCWEQVLAGDMVTDEGHAVQEVVFVMHGCLQAWTMEGYHKRLDMNVAELDPNTPWESIDSRCDSRGSLASHVDNHTKELEIPSGAWFGEASLFDEDRVYTALIVAVTECELAVLSANEYFNIVKKYPWLWERHQKIQKEILAGTISMEDLKFKEKKTDPRQNRRKSLFTPNINFSLFQRDNKPKAGRLTQTLENVNSLDDLQCEEPADSEEAVMDDQRLISVVPPHAVLTS